MKPKIRLNELCTCTCHNITEQKVTNRTEMAKLTPKEKMEIETVNLIKTVTNIEEDEENFEICERFCLSNLLYHKFLDPDENKINRVLSGLEQKFRVHAQPEKANCLKALVSKYKSQGSCRN